MPFGSRPQSIPVFALQFDGHRLGGTLDTLKFVGSNHRQWLARMLCLLAAVCVSMQRICQAPPHQICTLPPLPGSLKTCNPISHPFTQDWSDSKKIILLELNYYMSVLKNKNKNVYMYQQNSELALELNYYMPVLNSNPCMLLDL